MMNTLDAKFIEFMLAEDFHYASQWVFDEIKNKKDYLAYIAPKLEAIKISGQRVFAEMAWLDIEFPGPCVVIAQGKKTDVIGLILVQVEHEMIKRIDFCSVPSPASAKRTGEYPGLTN